jgi:hypothetical protein
MNVIDVIDVSNNNSQYQQTYLSCWLNINNMIMK